MEGIELLVFILARGRGEQLLRMCAAENVSFSLILRGHGTAGTQIMSILGIGDPEKDIVLLSISRNRADEILNAFAKKLGLERPGVGIAFTIPFSAVANQFITYDLFAGSLDMGQEQTELQKLLGRIKGKKGGEA